MISGYAYYGYVQQAIQIFDEICKDGIQPNDITFISLLHACSHGGLPDQSLQIIKLMKNKFGIIPDVKHHSCVVDALGRSGRLDEAYNYIQQMESTNIITWITFLGACRLYNDIE